MLKSLVRIMTDSEWDLGCICVDRFKNGSGHS